METLSDRREAGRLLAEKLTAYAGRPEVIVLGLARGGVEVASEIAQALRLPLDVFLVRKLGVPGYEELAMGAISSGEVQVIDPDVVESFGLSQAEIDRVIKAERRELERREQVYREGRRLDLQGRTVILVDDGIATGSTMRAAIAAVRESGVARVVVAVGVAPLSTYLILASEADEVVCLMTPRDFWAVGQFYDDFPQLTDEDVRNLLVEATEEAAHTSA
jgi:putative phosphoribosyl transferase